MHEMRVGVPATIAECQQGYSPCSDKDIRPLLKQFILQHDKTSSDAVLFEEFALWGGAIRADFAALGALSHGYEIKSAKDTLKRLTTQKIAYNAVFERVTLVAVDRHLQAGTRIPNWWGIIRVEECGDALRLIRVRDAGDNPRRDPLAIASLLWRHEALDLLSNLGLDAGLRSKPAAVLIEKLASEVSVDSLAQHVRQAIRSRGDWKAGSRLKRCGDTFRRSANSWNCPRMPFGRTRR